MLFRLVVTKILIIILDKLSNEATERTYAIMKDIVYQTKALANVFQKMFNGTIHI